jgi:hypothetical protein
MAAIDGVNVMSWTVAGEVAVPAPGEITDEQATRPAMQHKMSILDTDLDILLGPFPVSKLSPAG